MPHRSWELRIVDIVDAIETVLDYTAGMTLEQFVTDRKTIQNNLPPLLPVLRKLIGP